MQTSDRPAEARPRLSLPPRPFPFRTPVSGPTSNNGTQHPTNSQSHCLSRRVRRQQGRPGDAAGRDLNQLHVVPAADNPYPAGLPITSTDCSSIQYDQTTGTPTSGLPVSATVNGATITGQPVINLAVACGNNVAPYYAPYPGYAKLCISEMGPIPSTTPCRWVPARTVGDLTLSFAYTYSHSIDN